MLSFLLISFIVLLIIGVPIADCMGISAALTLILSGSSIISVAQKMTQGINTFIFVAIPLFLLAGELMNSSKITDKIFSFANTVMGRIPGGMGHVCIFSSVIFAGMSGSAVADAGGLGSIEISAMERNGYDKDFSAALVAAAATIGPIIPPSIPMIIYGGITQVSIGKLFLGGVIPGLLMASCLSIYVYIVSKKKNFPIRPKMTTSAILKSSREAIIPLMAPVILLVGLTTGIFTPTEAAAVAAFYALVIGVFLYKELTFKVTFKVFVKAVENSAVIVYIIACASLFSYVLGELGIMEVLTNLLLSITHSSIIMILLINGVVFIMGMFMETSAIQILILPLLLPILNGLHVNLLAFGVAFIINLMIGTITPPVGVCLFTVTKVADVKLEDISKAIWPFVVPIVAAMLLCIFVPSIVTWLPNLLMK